MTPSDYIQLSTLLIAIIVLIVSVIQFKHQMRLSFFADYTKRYQEILLHLPNEIYTDNADYAKLSDEVKMYLRAYIDLCSEEFFLNEKGHIDKEVWENWVEGIKAAFKKKIILEAWSNFERQNYPYFVEWIDKEVIKGSIEKN